MGLKPEQEAAYALDFGVSRADLKPEVQAEYDRLLADPARRQAIATNKLSAQPRTYRPSGVTRVIAGGCATAFFAVGLSMMTVGPSEGGGVGAVLVGAVVLLFSLLFGAVIATNRLAVTATGLVYYHNLRRKSIDWPGIKSFGVESSWKVSNKPFPIIYLNEGKQVLLMGLASFSHERAIRIAGQLTEYQRALGPAGSGASLGPRSV